MAVKFNYCDKKAAQAVHYLLHKAGCSVDKLKLIKLIFYSDLWHIEQYGRPVVGGSYFAMQHVPVSSELLNDINGTRENVHRSFELSGNSVSISEECADDALSETDKEMLDRVFDTLGKKDAFSLRDLTHKLECYKKNEPSGRGRKAIPYEDFFLDLPDKRMLDTIKEREEVDSLFG